MISLSHAASNMSDVVKGAMLGASTTSIVFLGMLWWTRGEKNHVVEDEESDDEELTPNLQAVVPRDWSLKHAPFKMLLLVNQELYDESGKKTKMTNGKVAAQCCHAALGAYKRGMKRCPGAVRAWEVSGQAKIAIKCPTEEELMEIQKVAVSRGLCAYLVCDAGRTQIAPGSKTVLALGPAPVTAFDDFTKHLKLL